MLQERLRGLYSFIFILLSGVLWQWIVALAYDGTIERIKRKIPTQLQWVQIDQTVNEFQAIIQ
ncbi:MAG: hypothetical protein DID90_2727553719 [Candidatus Nitrotoga sp. LAW]|nr:MAG: hypothetical protein DID90_2727553719 [Candidatus Nitrotoga sp. LAW]